LTLKALTSMPRTEFCCKRMRVVMWLAVSAKERQP